MCATSTPITAPTARTNNITPKIRRLFMNTEMSLSSEGTLTRVQLVQRRSANLRNLTFVNDTPPVALADGALEVGLGRAEAEVRLGRSRALRGPRPRRPAPPRDVAIACRPPPSSDPVALPPRESSVDFGVDAGRLIRRMDSLLHLVDLTRHGIRAGFDRPLQDSSSPRLMQLFGYQTFTDFACNWHRTYVRFIA